MSSTLSMKMLLRGKKTLNTTAVVLEANEEAMARRHLPVPDGRIGGASAESASRTGRGRCSAAAFLGIWRRRNGGALTKKGFSPPEHQLTWISGSDAEIDLPSPQKYGAPIDFGGEAFWETVPPRGSKVKPMGFCWALDLVDPSVQFYSLTIKAAANTAPSLKLHFSLSPLRATVGFLK
jgi:hypothetical protein